MLHASATRTHPNGKPTLASTFIISIKVAARIPDSSTPRAALGSLDRSPRKLFRFTQHSQVCMQFRVLVHKYYHFLPRTLTSVYGGLERMCTHDAVYEWGELGRREAVCSLFACGFSRMCVPLDGAVLSGERIYKCMMCISM